MSPTSCRKQLSTASWESRHMSQMNRDDAAATGGPLIECPRLHDCHVLRGVAQPQPVHLRSLSV
ncbi:hypothetical protein EJ03DRAFT_325966 [Teratosphaeria nubilosa]|uniref:Uncharacterized protein n=1 Tax=Teratosphaeria nubilosa TaxID=161662 RepID=A0A6G1LG75_9PEZI|nr:hypothetical protein EJ03DRAFT_325966 [Teratosphaeria nubilosa]